MLDIAAIIEAGAGNPWIYLPAALLLGALHALEPGHSKSMMAAFIVAVRGTPRQAVVLGAAAAIGHTLVIWVLVLLGLWLGDRLILDRAEPWLVLATGLLVMLIGLRILAMTGGSPLPGSARKERARGHGHDAGHGHAHSHAREGHSHGGGRGFDHNHASADAHAAAHAGDIERRLTGRPVTTLDIAWFGFTAGLLPCPAAFAVLLVCLQIGAVVLGVAMVAAFSIGLAITLVAVGVAAAWGARAAGRRFPRLETAMTVLPYLSAAIVLGVGALVTLRGLAMTGAI